MSISLQLAETSLFDGVKIIAMMVFAGFMIARKVAGMFSATQKSKPDNDDWQPWIENEPQPIPQPSLTTPPPLYKARKVRITTAQDSSPTANPAYYSTRSSGPFIPTPPVQGRSRKKATLDLKFLNSKASLRQAVLTHEILAPPLALRK